MRRVLLLPSCSLISSPPSMKINTLVLPAIVTFIIMTVSCSDKVHCSRPSVTCIEDIEVISLYGTWEEMGAQYGELAGGHLRHVLDFMTGVIGGDISRCDSIKALSKKLYSRYPYRFKQFFRGVERTSGLTAEQLMMINAVEYSEGFFCSGIAAWGDYASGNLVYGRNYDALSYAPLGEDVIITVFHPSDGSLATATIGYAGEIYAVNAINEKGIFLELNNGRPTVCAPIDFELFASTTSLLEVMLEAEDIDYLDAFFKTHRSFAPFIIGVADEDEARSYEWCAAGTKNATGANPDGLLVMTNHYVSPDWTYPVPSDENSWMSITRRRNLLGLAESNKGRIDEKMMCGIIATPVQDGGPMQDITRYQLVYTLDTKKLLVCIEQGPSWIEVDLNDYF